MTKKTIYVRILQTDIKDVIKAVGAPVKLLLDYNKERRDYDFNIHDPDGKVIYTVPDMVEADCEESNWNEVYGEVKAAELDKLAKVLVTM